MARRRYYRRGVRVVAAKKKWASQMVFDRLLQGSGTQSAYLTLVENSTESATPTPVIIKTGNFKVQVDAFADINDTETRRLSNAVAFVAYVPQGYPLTATSSPYQVMRDFIKQHPEWIICWKQLDFSSVSGAATVNSVSVSFSSRLKRNLNSGDKIIFSVAYQGDGFIPSTQNSFTYQVAAQYWTCAN